MDLGSPGGEALQGQNQREDSSHRPLPRSANVAKTLTPSGARRPALGQADQDGR